MRKFVMLVSLLAVLLIGMPVMGQDQTIVDIAVGNPDFSTLVAAVTEAGLVETLSGEGPFTVFAPTNSAFEALGADTIASVLADKELLTSILTYHVVAGKVMAADVVGLTSATTVQGTDISISVKDGMVYLNDTIQVVTTDIEASNGVIHVIDGVLMPAQESVVAAEEMVHIRVAHFSPDTPAVDVYVNGELSAVAGLEFPTVTDWIELPAGSYNLAVAPADTSIDSAAIGPADFDLPAGAWITVAAVGSLTDGTLKPAILVENFMPTAGNARVSVFHAIEDAPAVDVLAGGNRVVPALAFPGTQGNNDGFYTLDVPAGSYDLQVVPAGSTSPVVLDLPGTELAADTNYFVAAVGSLAEPQVVVSATSLVEMGMMAEAPGTIVDIAVGNPDFSTLVAAVTEAGLVETLSGEGPFTVFAPTNAAFEALGADTIASVLADKELLTSILTYHVVAGKVLAADVVGLTSATTVQGTDITISVKDGMVYLNDTIQVIVTDIEASNGVIHVIDGVLIPAQ
jgi:transforming growth factor-beta-induced protein